MITLEAEPSSVTVNVRSVVPASPSVSDVSFTDNELQVMPGIPVLSRTRGVLQFSDRGLTLKNLRARALGGDAQIDGGLSFEAAAAESPLQLKITGNVTAEGLRQARELGLASRLAQRAAGASSYIATLGLRRGQPELLITSDLRGMALNLPATAPVRTYPVRVRDGHVQVSRT